MTGPTAPRSPRKPLVILGALVALQGALALAPAALQAQDPPDFLFQEPRATIGIRFGYAVPRAQSEIFDFTQEQLTVERGDFAAPSFGGELAVRVTERVDVALAFTAAESTTRSEFRDWVDVDDRPIEQETTFDRKALTLGTKLYFKDRGRPISRFAWVPSSWAPYVGAGAGFVWYEFLQEGDFVDFETLDIFNERFRSTGRSGTAQVFTGLDYSLTPRFLLNGEARYSWGSVEMERDFVGFDEIDLAGFQATLGFSVRL